jgi:hypothetical protein
MRLGITVPAWSIGGRKGGPGSRFASDDCETGRARSSRHDGKKFDLTA